MFANENISSMDSLTMDDLEEKKMKTFFTNWYREYF